MTDFETWLDRRHPNRKPIERTQKMPGDKILTSTGVLVVAEDGRADDPYSYAWLEEPAPTPNGVARGMVIAMPATLFLWAAIALVYHWIAA